jgi:hypothetical protein
MKALAQKYLQKIASCPGGMAYVCSGIAFDCGVTGREIKSRPGTGWYLFTKKTVSQVNFS